MFIVFLLCATIAVSGGFIVGFIAGKVHERELARLRRPLAPHEAARLVVTELRGPLPSRPDPSLSERVERGRR